MVFSEALVRVAGIFTALLIALTLVAPPSRGEEAPSASNPGEEQPEVTIVHRGGEVIEEYRVHGRLYMIKVTPRKGVPYYLIDTNGDGNFDQRRTELTEKPFIPNWILLQWK
jgi:hypothetical protein